MSFAATSRNSSAQTARLIAPFAFVLLGVFTLCALFGYMLARESDARHQDQRRASLLGVVDGFCNMSAKATAAASADLAAGVGRDLARARAGRACALSPRACLRQISRATQLATSEAEAHQIAYEDAVTGLPNRRMSATRVAGFDAGMDRRARAETMVGTLRFAHPTIYNARMRGTA